MMVKRMTRIKRILTDLALPAAKFFRPQMTQIFTNKTFTSFMLRSSAQTKFVPEFVKICVICGLYFYAGGGIKSVFIRVIRFTIMSLWNFFSNLESKLSLILNSSCPDSATKTHPTDSAVPSSFQSLPLSLAQFLTATRIHLW